jgi:hypothetical protein
VRDLFEFYDEIIHSFIADRHGLRR